MKQVTDVARVKRATFGSSQVLSAAIRRSQEIARLPWGKTLLIPVINAFYGAFLNDPPEQRTEEFLRSQVACSYDNLNDFKLTIDGVEVPKGFFRVEKSILFDVQLPKDNVLGVDESTVPQLLLSPSVDQGFYLFVTPLTPGEHTVAWTASQTCPFGNSFQDNTYSLTIGAPQ
jgi:hypothetical protein